VGWLGGGGGGLLLRRLFALLGGRLRWRRTQRLQECGASSAADGVVVEREREERRVGLDRTGKGLCTIVADIVRGELRGEEEGGGEG
jgi:hypothetical protein